MIDLQVASQRTLGGWREAALAGAVFLALSYWFFGANLFAREAIAPMDLLTSVRGYAESSVPLPVTNREKSDVLDSILPGWRNMKSEIRSGRLPQWNPLPSGGEPAISNLPYGFVTPRFLCFLLFPDALGYSLGLIVQLAIAGLGTYLLCRLAVGVLPALFAGATYMMCGFNAAWTQWAQVSTSCWIPWLLSALVLLMRQPSGGRIVLVACATAAMIFGGFPAVAAYGLYLAALVGAWLAVDRFRETRSVRSAAWPAGAAVAGVVLGFALAALQLLPFREYLHAFDFSYRHAQGIDLANAWYLLYPFAAGTPRVESSAYVGIVGLLFTAVGVLLSPLRAARRRRVPALSAACWLLAVAITWTAIYDTPHLLARVLYRLPVLNSNASNRMTSILGLELAVLAALGLEALLNLFRADAQAADSPVRRAGPAAVAALLLVVQCNDVAQLGRAHNAVVPGSAFFPATPAIDFVRERIVPGQSVIGTVEAYLIPGTLGSYGLPEWYAHAFRRAPEKALLERVVSSPWVTATAAAFTFENIDLRSPWIDALGIRFVMTSDRKPALVAQDGNDRPSPLLAEHRIGQVLTIGTPMAPCSVSAVIGTYDRPYADTDLRLRVFRKGGSVVAEAVAPGSTVLNNEAAEFRFGRPLPLAPGEYEIVIEALKGSAASPISVWTMVGEDRYRDGHLTIDGKPAAGDMRFRLEGCAYQPPPGWKIGREANRILVLERNDSPPGGYLVDAESFDSQSPPRLQWTNVRLTSNSPDRQTFQVVADRPSFFVRTMRRWDGWTAFVDGKEAPLQAYQGALAAVEVGPGSHRIEWKYRAARWRRGLAVSAAALLAATALVFIDRRRSRRRTVVE